MAGTNNEQLELVDESARPRFVNSLTYVQKRASRKRWTREETDAFYVALRKYGSDFEMVSAVMPGRNRYDIRNKFKMEERKNARRVTETLLGQRTPPVPTTPSAEAAEPELGEGGPLASLEAYSMAPTPEANGKKEQQLDESRDGEAEAEDSNSA
ncbi:hypothetical protein BX070DRAFT_187545 [Coemansia spiralis]|nr:hypothetical protein BX070DRAFT_187545 [Coemansia spiralis]